MLIRTPSACRLIVVILLTVGACTPTGNQTEVPLPTFTPTRSATSTAIPVTANWSTPTPSTATVAVVPTLSREGAYNAITDLLRSNDSCQLPCWWSFVPGTSASADAYVKLTTFRSIANLNDLHPTGGIIYLTYPKKDLLVDLNIGIHSNPENQTIKVITLFTQVRRQVGNSDHKGLYGSTAFTELFSAYSLQSVLSKNGPPSQVLIRADVYDYSSDPDTFEITLLYPEKGIFVRYDALGERTGSKISGCPSKAFIELWLLSPDDKDSYQQVLSSVDENWEGNFPSSKTVDEAANMTVDDFYKAFKGITNRCVETPLSIWPGH